MEYNTCYKCGRKIVVSFDRGTMIKLPKFEAYDYQIKTPVKQSNTASRIYLPESWSNKKVAVILLEK